MPVNVHQYNLSLVMLGLGENTVSKYLHSFVFLLTEGLVLNTFNRNKGAV